MKPQDHKTNVTKPKFFLALTHFLYYLKDSIYLLISSSLLTCFFLASHIFVSQIRAHYVHKVLILFRQDFVRIWSSFQSQGLEKLKNVSPEGVEVILWTSTLTEEKYIHNLPKEDYTIQIWTEIQIK